MTLTRAARAGGIGAAILLVVALGVFWGNQRLASASVVPPDLGSQIVCYVFTRLDRIGPPVPHLLPDTCPATPPASTGTLKVVKLVQGGSAHPSDFSIHVTSGGSEIQGSPQPGSPSGLSYIGLAPGSYTVSETGGSGNYTPAFSGGCNGSGVVDLPANGIRTCTITNTFNASPPPSATLFIVKHTVGGDGTFGFTLSGATSATPSVSTTAGAGTSTAISLGVGLSTLSEDTASGWTLSALNCISSGASISTSVPGGAQITAHAGDTATCTFTNTQQSGGGGAATSSDLSFTKDVNTTTPNPGDTITYTLTVANAGPAAAVGVSATDVLPGGLTFVSSDATTTGTSYDATSGLWSIGSLANGANITLHIMATVQSGTGGQPITNSATVSDTNGDPDTSNNTASKSITPSAPPSGGGNNAHTPPAANGGGGGGGGGNGPIYGAPYDGIVLGASTSTATSTLQSCDMYLTAFIKTGQQNDAMQVKRLQRFLNQFEGATLAESGVYDSATLAATEAFQGKYASDILAPWGISRPTGFVYLTTRKKVNEIYCDHQKTFPLTAEELQIISQTRGTGAQTSNTPTSGASTVTTAPPQQTSVSPTHFATGTPPTGAATSTQAGAAAQAPPDPLLRAWEYLRGLFNRSP